MLQEIVTWFFPPQCGGCDAAGSGVCLHCLPPFSQPLVAKTATLNVHAVAQYEGAVRRCVLALKDGRRDVARSIGERLSPLIEAGSALVPVPTTRARRAVRGFDGAEFIAKVAAKIACAEVRCNLAHVAGDAQRGRNRSARLAAKGRFRYRERLEGIDVTLVDDVMTTGSTLEDCAATLRAGGAFVKRAIVFAVREHESNLEWDRLSGEQRHASR